MTVRTARLYKTTYVPVTSVASREHRYRAIKRAIDFAGSLVLIAFLAPLMALIALLVILDSPGPAVFRQQRVRGDQDPSDEDAADNTFTLYKFRSMRSGADPKVHQAFVETLIERGSTASKQSNGMYKLADDPRVTRIGHILRATSLDELPQLFNVLKGDMSLVGPRPALPYEVKKYRGWHRRRLGVPAGITGLWQISGRSGLSFDEMVRLDNQYAENHSLSTDLHILVKTIPTVIFGHGAC